MGAPARTRRICPAAEAPTATRAGPGRARSGGMRSAPSICVAAAVLLLGFAACDSSEPPADAAVVDAPDAAPIDAPDASLLDSPDASAIDAAIDAAPDA